MHCLLKCECDICIVVLMLFSIDLIFFQAEYFRLLGESEKHVAVHMVHIDTEQCGSAFPDRKDSPYARYSIHHSDTKKSFHQCYAAIKNYQWYIKSVATKFKIIIRNINKINIDKMNVWLLRCIIMWPFHILVIYLFIYLAKISIDKC